MARRGLELQSLLDLRSTTSLKTLAADVIAADSTGSFRIVTIDRGSQHGVRRDMAVLAPQGVVGRIIGPVASRASRVQLIIDRNAAVGAIVERSRAGGMVIGVEGDPPLRMDLASNLADVVAGDVVVASGVDGIFPKGFVIGTVERSERGKNLYRDITVRPAVNFSGLEEVLIVLSPARSAQPEEASKPREGAK